MPEKRMASLICQGKAQQCRLQPVLSPAFALDRTNPARQTESARNEPDQTSYPTSRHRRHSDRRQRPAGNLYRAARPLRRIFGQHHRPHQRRLQPRFRAWLHFGDAPAAQDRPHPHLCHHGGRCISRIDRHAAHHPSALLAGDAFCDRHRGRLSFRRDRKLDQRAGDEFQSRPHALHLSFR
ncbi:hypothetical protein D3C86_1314860 [compost metagenome]